MEYVYKKRAIDFNFKVKVWDGSSVMMMGVNPSSLKRAVFNQFGIDLMVYTVQFLIP